VPTLCCLIAASPLPARIYLVSRITRWAVLEFIIYHLTRISCEENGAYLSHVSLEGKLGASCSTSYPRVYQLIEFDS